MKRPLAQIEAIALALAGYTCWVLADTSLKIAGASTMPAYEVIAVVGLGIVLVQWAWAAWRGDISVLRPRDKLRQLLRSSLDLINILCVVVALRHVSLALFYILVFSAPLVITLLAALLLGESLDWRRGVALLTGFAGVVVAAHPSAAVRPGDRIGYLACLVCVLAFSLNMVWSRRLTQTESPESLTLFSGAVMAVFGSLLMLHHAAPVTSLLAVVLLASGAICVFGSVCFFVALRHAPAAIVSQFHYSQLLTGALIAWLLWHERMTPQMLAGAVLIIGSGWYTAARSYSLSAQVAPVAGGA